MAERNAVAVAVGERLQEGRQKRDLTQGEVATALNVAEDTYGSYERGYRMMPLTVLRKVPAVLGVSVAWLLGLPEVGDVAADEWGLLYDYRTVPEEKRPTLRRAFALIASLSATSRQPVEDVDARIADYEQKYGMTSEEFLRRCREGTIRDTFDANAWRILLQARGTG